MVSTPRPFTIIDVETIKLPTEDQGNTITANI